MSCSRYMKKIIVNTNSKQKKYGIYIGTNLIEKINSLVILTKYSKAIIITDQNTPAVFVKKLREALSLLTSVIVLSAGEEEKNIENAQKIWKALLNFGCDRKSVVINLGGGVIGDTGGFAASTFMRGIDFINIPTTLLSQVDAGVGGKNGINFLGIKNLIGTFNQPIAILIDIAILKALPKREFLSGFAEIIKHGLIADKKYFGIVSSKYPLEFTTNEMQKIISISVQIKAKVVQKDETENDLRKLLNFGHTIGHAIEALSLETEKPMLHGEAISIGMFAESIISLQMKMITDSELEQIRQSLINAGLPISTKDMDVSKIIRKMQSDKKNAKGQINFTLLSKIGNAVINQQVADKIINQALKQIQSK